MMRALYSGVSGLRTHQTKMDVIGNNIANVNTVGFKSSSVTFNEIMYQTTQKASGPNALTGTGGTNPKQIGLGVTMGSMNTTIATPGATQTTGNPFDLKITGDSFFVVNNGTQNLFTKAGAFSVDEVGNLVMSSNGYNVMGWQVDEASGGIRKDTVSPLRIMKPTNMTSDPEATTNATVTGIIDKNSTQVSSSAGEIMTLTFYDSLGYSYTAKMSIHQDHDVDGKPITNQYSLKLDELTDDYGNPIISKNADGDYIGPDGSTIDPANAATISTMMQADGATVKYNPDTGYFDSIENGNDNIDDPKSDKFGIMEFNVGELGKNFSDIKIDFSETKIFDNGGTSTIGADPGDYTGEGKGEGAGKKVGEMIGLTVAKNGMIYGSYDNGNTKLLGQIAVAKFSNPSGLSKEGDNLYSETLNSGRFDGVGDDVSTDSGDIATGALEMSNVDLSAEFTEMITTQRGFQANSRIITTSDSLLEELVNLKR